MSRLSLPALALAVCLLNGGCGGSHSWDGGSAGEHGFKEGVRFDYDIISLTYDGRVFLVLAVDGRTGGSMTVSENSKGVFSAVDGRQIPWSCATPDGTGGTVTIADQPFDLGQGAVFLISLKANPVRVQQLAVDMSKLQGGKAGEQSNAIGEAEPRIKAFLKECRGEK